MHKPFKSILYIIITFLTVSVNYWLINEVCIFQLNKVVTSLVVIRHGSNCMTCKIFVSKSLYE